MVNLLRRFQQPLLITLTVLVIIAFVILYGGPGTRLDRLGSERVATIYNRGVQPAEYTSIARQFEICRMMGMFELIIPLAQNARTMSDVTDNYVWNTIVLRHQAKELGIEPTENQVAEAIQHLPAFQNNGQYDHTRYLQAIQAAFNPRGLNNSHLEEIVRDLIRLQTIREVLSASSAPSPDELESAYLQKHQTVEASVVKILKEEVGKTVKVSEDEVKKAYEERKDGLKAPEKRKVQHVFFALPEKKKEGPAPSAEDMQKVADKSEDFAGAAMAEGAKFEEVAKKFGLETKTSPAFSMGERVESLSNQPRVTAAAFQLSAEKSVSDPVATEAGYYVLRLLETEAARPLTFDEAKKQITEGLTAERIRETLALKAADARKKIEEGIKGGKTFAQAAETAGLKAEVLEPFSRASNKLKGADASVIVESTGTLKAGQTSAPLESAEATLLVHVTARQPLDKKDFEEKKSSLAPMLEGMRSDALLTEWMDRQRAAAGLQLARR